jgi:hypothetical protein
MGMRTELQRLIPPSRFVARMAPPARLRSPAFLAFVFAAVAIVIGVSFFAYSLQPTRPSTRANLVFASVVLAEGNASFVVRNVSGGPYGATGFQLALIVNEFAAPWVALGSNNSVTRIPIGPNYYRVVWSDSNGDGAVDVGDSFLVSGDGGRLPALSYFEVDLRWQGLWTAKVTWSTP